MQKPKIGDVVVTADGNTYLVYESFGDGNMVAAVDYYKQHLNNMISLREIVEIIVMPSNVSHFIISKIRKIEEKFVKEIQSGGFSE